MIEYKILVPLATNTGDDTIDARNKFDAFLLAYVGGYSEGATRRGVWRGNDGTVFHDYNLPYYVATDKAFDAILAKWFECFPDQEACYYAAGPYAFIVPRPVDRSVDAGTVALAAGRHDRGWRK